MLKIIITIVSMCCIMCACQNKVEPDPKLIAPVPAPFEGLDTITTNDWWNRLPNPIIDVKVERDQVIGFALYTVSNQVMKMTAQLFPLYPNESRDIRLEIMTNGKWSEVQTATVNDIGWSAQFRVEAWDQAVDHQYRLRHGEQAVYEGTIKHDPKDKDEIVLAALSCNSNQDRGDRNQYVKNINHQNPDLVFFAGDQSYDHKEHTAAWLKFGSQFGELCRNRPCITIPDDHDIGQGNIWGESGKQASSMAGNDGGYFFDVDYVKMVERAQTSHLPDPYDPTPIERGIKVYYTSLQVGGVDFAIIEDRKFKSGPKGKIPQQGPRPDHIRNPAYDPASIDLEGLVLLGDRQLSFLDQWARAKPGVSAKAVLSQTGFCGGAHIHGNKDNRLHADLDSNGWPQTGRNKALAVIRKAGAVHIAGDQHLATLIKHGIDEYDDGPWAFIVPAIVNNYYSRWWWPEDEQAGIGGNELLPWTGQYLDGFHNKITMHAYVNPENPAGGSGYGIIRFDLTEDDVTFECWPRDVDVTQATAQQFTGWPKTVSL